MGHMRKGDLVLLYEPATLYCLQSGLEHRSFMNAGERRSTLDDTVVLDVVAPIIAPDPFDRQGFVLLNGYHRCAEAAMRNIGIEAVLARNGADLEYLPSACFDQYVDLQWINCLLLTRKSLRERLMEMEIFTLADLVQRYNL